MSTLKRKTSNGWEYICGSGNAETEIFVAEYNTTTYAEIYTAVNSGKYVFVKIYQSDLTGVIIIGAQVEYRLLPLTHNGASTIMAGGNLYDSYNYSFSIIDVTDGSNEIASYKVTINSEDEWSVSKTDLTPSIFIAEYGDTTIGELQRAEEAGKALFCRMPRYGDTTVHGNIERIFPLLYVTISNWNETDSFVFGGFGASMSDSTSMTASIGLSNEWTLGTIELSGSDVTIPSLNILLDEIPDYIDEKIEEAISGAMEASY